MRPPILCTLPLLLYLVLLLGHGSCACVAPTPYAYNSNCYQECPWNNTLITYLSNTTNDCLTSCPNGQFADDSTKRCVTTCPSDPIQTYYDDVHNRCVENCSTDPSYFAAPNQHCVEHCPDPTYADESLGVCVYNCTTDTFFMVLGSARRCVNLCYPNYYANSSRYCVSAADCKQGTASFYADDSTNLCVETCPVDKGTFADDTTQRCVFYCPLGSYADSTSQKCLNECPREPEYFGSNITRQCLLQCNQGQFSDPLTFQCTLVCPVGYYGDYSTRQCVSQCPQSQSTYGDPLSRLCVPICPANYYADDHTDLCVAAIDCSQATFGNPVTQHCVTYNNCPTGFYVDASTGLCVVRCTTWGNPLSSFCEASCPWQPDLYYYYEDSSTNRCVQTCPVEPRSFGDNNTRTCVSKCPDGSFGSVVSMTCLLTCPTGFFGNSQTNECVANCTQNSSSILYFHKPTLTCVSECPIDYHRDNASMTCEMTCTNHTFAYEPTRECLFRCPDGYFGDEFTQTCATSCPIQNGQFADPSTNLCVDVCPSNPDLFGQDLNNGNKTCIADCTIDGFYEDTVNRLCVDVCNTTAGYFGDPSDGRCYAHCPSGYGDPVSTTCVAACPKTPKFYYGDNITHQCVLACPSQTYGDPNYNLCVSALNCSSGMFADDVTGLCVATCSQILGLYGDPLQKKCVSVCSFPYFADPNTQQCSLACSSGLFKDNSTKQCVRSCSQLPDLFNDPNSGFCEYNCTMGWFALAYAGNRQCLSMCPDNPAYLADLQNNQCVLKCANYTYKFINNTFRGCLDYCPPQVFSDSHTVDLFADNTTWQCVVECPYGYYQFKHPSDTKIRQCVRDCQMVSGVYYYAQDSRRECVLECPMQYEGTWGDSIDFRCVSSCSRFQYRDNTTSTCVYHCPDGYFANNVTWNCSLWCEEGWFAQTINNTCVRSCPTDYYGWNKECITQCPNNTFIWNDNTTWLCVSLCPSYPDTFADNFTVSCVHSCPTDWFADTATRSCLQAINCTSPTIADPITGRCALQCTKVPMYYLTNSTNLCGLTCDNGSFAYNDTNMCIDECPAPYYGVNTTVNYYCTQYCPATLYKWVNATSGERRCIAQCPTDEYRDLLTMTCVPACPDYYYSNSSNTLCVLSCAPLYADDSTKSCVEECPNGTTASNTTWRCQDYCDHGEYELNKTCYSSCDAPLFADNLTRQCVENCTYDPLTYADPLTNSCVLTCSSGEWAIMENLTCADFCPQGYFKQLTLRLCLQTCLEGYFTDNDTQTCVSGCSSSSLSFSDKSTNSCVTICPKDPDLFGHNNQCITQCPGGFFAENFTRQCVAVCPNVSTTYLNASWADDLTRRCLEKCSALSFAYTNDTHNVCLNTCPDGLYASIEDQACVQTCSNGSYALNSSKTCVVQCPPGQWADQDLRVCMPDCKHNGSLFSDNSSASCVSSCPSYPDLFADPTTEQCVLTCPATYYAYNITRQCVMNCPDPYFADPFLLECVQSCLIPNLAFADSVLRQCTSSCTNHTINGTVTVFFQDNTTLTCVAVCPASPEKYYGHNQTNTCVQRCPDGTYGDNDTQLCLDVCIFETPKFTWANRNTEMCVTLCPYGYFADNSTGACEQTCSNGTFADSSTRRCVLQCPNDPTSYSAVVNSTGLCVYNCPNGTYSSQVSVSCVTTCPTSPTVYYTYQPTNACVKQCIYPYFADLQTFLCTTSCQEGYYGNLTTKVCEICQVQCTTCSGYLVCDSCITGFYLYQNTCVISCPSYPTVYYAHIQSGVCFQNCPAPYFGEGTTGLCQLSCPTLTYPSLTTRICTACPTGCITCDALGCYTCQSGYTFLASTLTCNQHCNSTHTYFFNSVCYSSCPAGSYLTTDLVNCLACASPCATCHSSATNCTSCLTAYYYLGQCVDACPDNFYVDSSNNCQPCSSNPDRCTLPPLTYTIHTFTQDYRMQAYVVFNRAVTLTPTTFAEQVQISFGGSAVKSDQFTVNVHNSTAFLVVFDPSVASLNEQSLSFYFPPGSVVDTFGNTATATTISEEVDIETGYSEEVAAVSEPVASATYVLTIIMLVVLGLFFIKSGYPALITVELIQLIHLHIFLLADPLPYLQFRFLNALRYFNLMFMPKLFPSLNYTNQYYEVFTDDVSFLSNSPLILVFAFVLLVYLIVMALSSKKLMGDHKHARRLFKKVRKYRMRYGIIHDAFWLTFPYAVFISLLQFRMGSFSGSLHILNLALAILTAILFTVFTLWVVRLGHRYRNSPEKVPKKYSFLTLQPSASTLQLPMRYGRKLIFCAALVFPSHQGQVVLIIAANLVFLLFYLIYRPSKSVVTNKVIIFVEILLIILTCLFVAYDKLEDKSSSNQQGFAIGMLVVEALAILVLFVWCVYRLVLVIRATETWNIIYNKCTQNTDPEYLKEQQRKRDLEFDFDGLDNPSQEQVTEHPIERGNRKADLDEKFNIFDHDYEPPEEAEFDEKSRQPVVDKPSRPVSVGSSEVILRSSSSSFGSFSPRRTNPNYRHSRNKKSGHLAIVDNELNNSIEEVPVQPTASPSKKEQEKERREVIWDDVSLDGEDY